ncbi:MAG: hypothetical protein MJ025_00275 [Victivallaceae bacterium]|nr:hypothetical protein [Victivallaceae bacterium]
MIDRRHAAGVAAGYLRATAAEDVPGLDKAVDAIIDASEFRAAVYRSHYSKGRMTDFGIDLESSDLVAEFAGCVEVAVVAGTLGMGVERLLRRMQVTDMGSCVTHDAAASAILEEMLDEYEDRVIGTGRTFRMAPGYGDIPLALNHMLCETLDIARTTGISLTEGGMFIPQKSILGITGIQEN